MDYTELYEKIIVMYLGKNPKSASDRNVTDGNVRSGKVVPTL